MKITTSGKERLLSRRGCFCCDMLFCCDGHPEDVPAVEFRIEGIQSRILPEIERMMWMAPFGDGTGGKPLGVCCLAQGDLIGQACGQVIPFLNDGAPGGPDGQAGD